MQYQYLVSPAVPTHAPIMTDRKFRFQRPVFTESIVQFFFDLSFPYLVRSYAKSNLCLPSLSCLNLFIV